LTSVSLQWLCSDFMLSTAVEGHLIHNRVRSSPCILPISAGHCYRNIISTERGKKGRKREFPL